MRRVVTFLGLLLLTIPVVANAATAARSDRAPGVRATQVQVCPPSAKPSDTTGNGQGNGNSGGGGNTGTGGGGGGAGGANPGTGNSEDHGNAGGQGNTTGQDNANGNGNGNTESHGSADGTKNDNGNAGGNGNGNAGDATGCAPAPDEPGAVAGDGTLPPATAGESVNVEPVDGTVNVKQPGSDGFTPLTESAQLREGSVVDTRAGTVTLTSAGEADAQQTASFTGAKFQVRQPKAKAPVTELVLRGGDFEGCPRLDHARRAEQVAGGAIAARGGKRRGLWGNGHGRFRTRGRWGSATVRGTVWHVEDRCDGTLTTVARGVVQVTDFGLNHTVPVRAGEQYFSRVR